MPCAASPPMTFCQEKVVTSSLSHGRSCAKAADVASQSVRPARSAGIAVAVGHAHAGGGAVPCEADVVVVIECGHIDDMAVVGGVHCGVDLELFDNIGDPARAKAFPGHHFGRAFAQAATTWPSRRRRCRRRARCRSGSPRARPEFRGSDRWLRQFGFTNGRTVRAAQGRVSKIGQFPCGGFGAGAGGKTRVCRPRCRLRHYHVWYPYR